MKEQFYAWKAHEAAHLRISCDCFKNNHDNGVNNCGRDDLVDINWGKWITLTVNHWVCSGCSIAIGNYTAASSYSYDISIIIKLQIKSIWTAGSTSGLVLPRLRVTMISWCKNAQQWLISSRQWNSGIVARRISREVSGRKANPYVVKFSTLAY